MPRLRPQKHTMWLGLFRWEKAGTTASEADRQEGGSGETREGQARSQAKARNKAASCFLEGWVLLTPGLFC